MRSLQEFYDFLDLSGYDYSDIDSITAKSIELVSQLVESGEGEQAQLAELERQAFSINKSFNYEGKADDGKSDGLSWRFSGTQTLSTGETVPFYWPNVAEYTEKEFKYFEKRYNTSQNLFAKTEYGLLTYFGRKTESSQHKKFKQELCQHLFELSKHYLDKTHQLSEHRSTSYFLHSIELSLNLAVKEKLNEQLETVGLFIFSTHQNWDVTKAGTLRVLLDLSGLMSENFRFFKDIVDFDAVIRKNLEGAIELEKEHLWGAIYAVNTCLEIQQKRKMDKKELLLKKANLYLQLAEEAERTGNIAALSFTSDAVTLFKQAKSASGVDQAKGKYAKLRGQFEMGKFSKEVPQDEIDSILAGIKQTVAQASAEQIIYLFIQSPWYPTVKKTEEMAMKLAEESVFMSVIPTAIMDKFGNTIKVFNTEKEKEEYNFWHTYGSQFQFGTFSMVQLFVEAVVEKKLTYDSVINFLENTWINEPIHRKYYGQEIEVTPLETLRPPLQYFITAMEKYLADSSQLPDLVTATDSLTLKIEGLLRYFVERLGIPTFRENGHEKIVMEKLLDELLADLAHRPPSNPEQATNFSENDRVLIKYVLTEKAGLNLRNKVAHSLMDLDEYSLGNLVVQLCIILKLSKYRFVPLNQENSHESNS